MGLFEAAIITHERHEGARLFKRSTPTIEILVKQTEPFDQPRARPSPGLWR
jgi:hypothetical protein